VGRGVKRAAANPSSVASAADTGGHTVAPRPSAAMPLSLYGGARSRASMPRWYMEEKGIPYGWY